MKNEKVIDPFPKPDPRGDLSIPIRIDQEIYGFSNIQANGYTIFLKPDEYKVFTRFKFPEKNLYDAADININFFNNQETRLLEDYAREWIRKTQITLDTFKSMDFLTQLCITYLIKYIQWANNQIEDKTEEAKEIINIFLKGLQPAIEKKVRYFVSKYSPKLEYGEVLSVALQFTNIALVGEEKKIIEDLLKEFAQDPKRKQKVRRKNRSLRIHPWQTYKPYKGRTTDVITLSNILLKSLFTTAISSHREPIIKISYGDFQKKMKSINSLRPQGKYVNQQLKERIKLREAVFFLKPFLNNYPLFLTTVLNENSERIYRPTNKYSFTQFLLGEKGIIKSYLWRYLKDRFKTNITSRRGPSLYQNYQKRHWSKYKKYREIPYDKREEILSQLRKILSPKEYKVVKSLLNNGYYNSSAPAQRKALERARKRIRASQLNIKI